MGGSLHSSNNYRGISLCNALCKLIDLIIIEKCDGYLYTSELQFAYKRDHSTMLCTAVYKETVSHFLENGSNVYACLLDASSAFDRVHYGKLFDVLMKRNMPAVFIRLLLDSYLNQRICAAWGACKSDFFQATNGVKQGSIISPILFTVYVDELIARLQASGLGCNIGRSYIGVLGYADDLTLLSPSVNALSKMVGICEEYAKEYDIVFNCKKTVGIQFGNRCNNCVIKLNGNEIKWQRSVKHLGNIIDQKLSDVEDCRFKKSILIGNVNKFIVNYSTLKNCSKRKLFQSYCTSFYGSELWSLSSKGLEECCIAWRKGARRIFNMPYKTHSFLVGPLSGQRSIDEMLYRKSLKFVYSVMNSNNSIVAHIGQLIRQSAKSPIGGNIACFRYKFRIDVDDTVLKNLRLVGRYFELSGERAVAASVAIDLQGMIGEGHVGFARDELGCMFDSVCTT